MSINQLSFEDLWKTIIYNKISSLLYGSFSWHWSRCICLHVRPWFSFLTFYQLFLLISRHLIPMKVNLIFGEGHLKKNHWTLTGVMGRQYPASGVMLTEWKQAIQKLLLETYRECVFIHFTSQGCHCLVIRTEAQEAEYSGKSTSHTARLLLAEHSKHNKLYLLFFDNRINTKLTLESVSQFCE